MYLVDALLKLFKKILKFIYYLEASCKLLHVSQKNLSSPFNNSGLLSFFIQCVTDELYSMSKLMFRKGSSVSVTALH